jgi:hypothetical protein
MQASFLLIKFSTMSTINGSTPTHFNITATVPDSTALSNVVDLKGLTLVGIRTPAVLTSTTITLNVGSDDDDALLKYTDISGSDVSMPIAVNDHIRLPSDDFLPFRRVQIQTDSNEVVEAVFTLVCRRIS